MPNGVERRQALPPNGMAHHLGLLAHQPAAAWLFFLFLFRLGYRGIVHPLSDEEDTERTRRGFVVHCLSPSVPFCRFDAAQRNLSSSHVTMASAYAPVGRQDRAPCFQQRLLPAMPIGTPLLG